VNAGTPRHESEIHGPTAASSASSAPSSTRSSPPRKLYKIGEVMKYSGISRQTLHNYTMLGLITEEERTPAGHRLYAEWVFERLSRIDSLKKQMSLKAVREQLERNP
jgi:hypothetical protein